MALEAATYVNDLVTTNPVGASDPKGQGDDHLRLIKTVLKNTFPNAVGAYTFQSTDPSAVEGPAWILDRFSASPAAADLIGGIIFRGRDSAAASIDYVNIVGRITDPVAGTTDSELGLQVRVAGALTEILTIAGAGIVGVGTGLTALNASNLSTGTVPSGRMAGSYTGITGTGALDAGSITSNFGSINIGADPITAGPASFTTIAGTTGTFTDVLLLINGAQATPTVACAANTDMGMYFPGGTAIAFSVDNAHIGRFANNGVHIGKTSGNLTAAGFSFFGTSTSNGLFQATRDHAIVGQFNVINPVGTETILEFMTSGVAQGSITITGATTAYNTSSDMRLKENPRDFDAGSIIDRLNIYHFDWKAGGSGYGIYAQEAYEIFPDAIFKGDEDKTWQADYTKFVPLLLKEVQNLRMKVRELMERI